MSFVDLMKNDVWSEADIKARLHAEIRSEISEFSETEINRALQGAALGLHTLTAAEEAAIAHFKAATDRVAVLGAQARADAALHHEALAVEEAQARLALPVVSPVRDAGGSVTNQAAVTADSEGRATAQAVVNAATQPVLDLIAQRAEVQA